MKTFVCRRCGRICRDWEAFSYGSLDRPKYVCLAHVPWWVRFRMRVREQQLNPSRYG